MNTKLISLKQENAELNQIHSQVLQQVGFRVHQSYQLFFKHAVVHPPKFRSCKYFFNITYPQAGYSIRGTKLITKVYGSIPIVLHRQIQGNIKQISIGYDTNWYLCVYTDYEPTKQ